MSFFTNSGSNPYSGVTVQNTGRVWGQPVVTFPTSPRFDTFDDLRRILGQTTTPTSNVKITTPSMQAGQTTLDKILSTFLSFTALQKGAGYVPTTTQPQNQYQYLPYDANQIAIGGGGTGATFGASIEQFITNNTGLLLVAGVAFVLFKSGRK